MEYLPNVFRLLLIAIIILAIIFRKGNKRLLWMLTLLFLIIGSAELLVIGGVLIYALPKEAVVAGINFPYIPSINAIVLLLLCFPLIFLCRNIKSAPEEEPPPKRWLWFCSGVVMLFSAVIFFMISIYYPALIGSDAPNPNVGVIANLIFSAVGSFMLYYASKFNSPAQPNLLRWLAFVCVLFFSVSTLSCMLILIFVLPPHGKIVYPFMSGILSLNITFLSFVTVGIAKDYVPKLKK